MISNVYKFASFLTLAALCIASLGAEDFRYKHRKGDQYRILSTVHEEVLINNRRSHQAEILNRITFEVIDESNGKGTLQAVYQTSERSVTSVPAVRRSVGSYHWAREYESVFEMDPLGRMNIDKKYFVPQVRDVPVFPGRNLKVGETWISEAHEVHDFSANFGIPEPYHIPFFADYQYLGERKWKNKTYPAFSVKYQVESQPRAVTGRVWPTRIAGNFNQIVYWDSGMGQPVASSESFKYVFTLSDGNTIEYRGTAEAEIIESHRMDKEKMLGEIIEEINRLDIHDVSVRVVDEGITISLDDIQFRADTAIMLPGEQEKLDKITEILLRYQERDILVGGHTALAGTAEGREKLSTERASVIADYLIAHKARPPERVVVRGYGANKPVAENITEEGKRKNRRVEITILEN